jgi:hypothetical protein
MSAGHLCLNQTVTASDSEQMHMQMHPSARPSLAGRNTTNMDPDGAVLRASFEQPS